MLDAASRCGIDRIMATPHYRNKWKNRAAARQVFSELRTDAMQRGITLQLGSEFYIGEYDRDRIDFIKSELCFEDSNALLLELSPHTSLEEAQDVIYPLQRSGIEIILAHPEKYLHIQNNRRGYEDFLLMGCKLQLSAEWLTFPFWNARKRAAKRMLAAGAYEYIASDAHSAKDYELFASVIKKYKL